MNKIGFLIATFPKKSETFIYREIRNLKNNGLPIETFAFKNGVNNKDSDHDNLGDLIKGTTYLSNSECMIFGLLRIHLVIKHFGYATSLGNSAKSKPNVLMLLLRAIYLSSILRKREINHLHVHWPYSTLISVLVHKLTNINYSLSIHAHEVEHDHGHFRLSLSKAKFISFCNKAAMLKVSSDKNLNIESEKLFLNYHGVDINWFNYKPIRQEDDKIKVISIGRLTEQKGFDKLIELCAEAKNKYDLPIELTLVGDGTLKEYLYDKASKEGFSKHFNITGWIDFRKIPYQLHKSDLLALIADNAHQGLPNVVLEAMSCGRPVITSEIPGIFEVLMNGQGGWIVKNENKNQFVEILQSIYKNRELISIKGLEARRVIEEKYSDQVHILGLKKLFDNII